MAICGGVTDLEDLVIRLSSDPAQAERQIESIIFYLTTCGYIDSEFDLTEKAFVRSFLRKLVAERVDPDERLAPEVRFEQIEKQHDHYVEVFQRIDSEVKELFSEAVADGEDPQGFVLSRLKLRCFEMFQALPPSDREALLVVVDEFINADGVVHPAEIKFRNELAELLGEEIILDEEDVVVSSIEVSAPKELTPTVENHPFFASFEHHYSSDPAQIRQQIAADLRLLDESEQLWERLRERGTGRLDGKSSIEDLGDARFLDGHVQVDVSPEPRNYELVVLGDLHGCYSNLKAAIMQSGFMEKVRLFREDPAKHPDVRLILLGDYIDRGRFSYNGVLRAVLKLFATVPEHVHVLRGNHEYYIEYQGRIYGGVKPAEAINTLATLLPAEVFQRYLRFFECMPNVLLFDRNVFVHGGIPRDALLRERWKDLSSLNDPDIRFQMLWSDPSRAEFIPDDLQSASARFSFGRRQFRKFMSTVGASLLVRGHEKVNAGLRDHYPDEDIRLLTVFSSGGVANDDIPADSNYRDVRPMALTITRRGDDTVVTPWAIDYRRYQDPDLNAFHRTAPEVDIPGQ